MNTQYPFLRTALLAKASRFRLLMQSLLWVTLGLFAPSALLAQNGPVCDTITDANGCSRTVTGEIQNPLPSQDQCW